MLGGWWRGSDMLFQTVRILRIMILEIGKLVKSDGLALSHNWNAKLMTFISDSTTTSVLDQRQHAFCITKTTLEQFLHERRETIFMILCLWSSLSGFWRSSRDRLKSGIILVMDHFNIESGLQFFIMQLVVRVRFSLSTQQIGCGILGSKLLMCCGLRPKHNLSRLWGCSQTSSIIPFASTIPSDHTGQLKAVCFVVMAMRRMLLQRTCSLPYIVWQTTMWLKRFSSWYVIICQMDAQRTLRNHFRESPYALLPSLRCCLHVDCRTLM